MLGGCGEICDVFLECGHERLIVCAAEVVYGDVCAVPEVFQCNCLCKKILVSVFLDVFAGLRGWSTRPIPVRPPVMAATLPVSNWGRDIMDISRIW